LNICIVTSSFPASPNDAVQAPFVIDFIKGLKKRGHRVFVFTQDREVRKEPFLDGVHVEWFSWIGSRGPLVRLNPLHPADFLRVASLLRNGRRSLVAFVKRHRIDACLALWLLPGGYFAHHAFRKAAIPYSVWALGSDVHRYGRSWLLFPMLERIVKDAAGVFADGFDLARKVEERFGRSCVFLATTRTLRGGALRPHPDAPGRRSCRFLFVGRLERVKGIDTLVESTAPLIAAGWAISLTVVGKGSLEGWIRRRVREQGIEDRVSLVGNVTDESLASLYGSSDCVVIPSRSESIPVVLSEALAFDRDLIVSDVGDMGTLAREYGVARVVPPEDPAALMAAIKERASPVNSEAQDHGNRREELKRLFDMETSVERFLADYK
jgi:glycosyltransferase involved in cell wall biosynthesis